MKTVKPSLKTVILLVALTLTGLTVFAQPSPDFSFTTNSLIAGTDKAVGAKYRFTNVKSGIDAIVTITGAVNATLAQLDQPAASGGGYDAALQPNITVKKLTTGYIDFKIDFVIASTTTPAPQPCNITALDIDGYDYSSSLRLWEFEQFDLGSATSAYYNFSGGEIAMSVSGTAIRATNTGGNEFSNINLSDKVRFTIYRSNVASINVRSGAINQDQFNDVTRQRSFYFARFSYANMAVLASSDVVNFSGVSESKGVKLNLELSNDHKSVKAEIERSADAQLFENIASLNVNSANQFSHVDNTAGSGVNYYRVKLYEANGNYTYSKILKINTQASSSSIAVYPTVISGQGTVSITSDKAYAGKLTIMDLSGRVVSQKNLFVTKGTMITAMDNVSGLKAGQYIAVLNNGTENLTSRFVVAGH